MILEVDVNNQNCNTIHGLLSQLTFFQTPLILILFFNIISISFFYKMRKKVLYNFIQLLLAVFSVLSAQKMNIFFRNNWMKLSFDKNYFLDDTGTFIFLFLLIPQIATSITISISLMHGLCRIITTYGYFERVMRDSEICNPKLCLKRNIIIE